MAGRRSTKPRKTKAQTPSNILDPAPLPEPTPEPSPEPEEGLPEPKKKRPRNDPTIDWEAIENAYVWGETISQRQDGTFTRTYPTLTQLSKRFGLSVSHIHYKVKQGKWGDRRLSVQKKTREEFDAELAKARARGTVDALGVLDQWLSKFAENVQSGRVRADSIADLNTVVRLQKFLEGGGADRVQHDVRITLEQLQQRHQQLRGRVLAAAGDVAGELAASDGDPLAGEVVESVGEEGAHEGEARETP